MVKVLEIAESMLNTPQKRDLAHRGLNLVFAVAAFNTFNNSEALSGEFFIGAVSLYSFVFEAVAPTTYNGVFGLFNAVSAPLSFFSNPINSLMQGYNATHRGINILDEVAENYRSELNRFD